MKPSLARIFKIQSAEPWAPWAGFGALSAFCSFPTKIVLSPDESTPWAGNLQSQNLPVSTIPSPEEPSQVPWQLQKENFIQNQSLQPEGMHCSCYYWSLLQFQSLLAPFNWTVLGSPEHVSNTSLEFSLSILFMDQGPIPVPPHPWVKQMTFIKFHIC